MQRNFSLVTFIFLVLAASLEAANLKNKNNNCGIYLILGTVKTDNSEKNIQIFSDSRSEINLKVKDEKISSVYDNKKVRIEGEIKEKIYYGKGKISITTVKEVLPDFLSPYGGDLIKLIHAKKCIR